MRKCEVCQKNDMVGVYSSSCGPISFAYCKECATSGAEPYGAVVAYISGAVEKGEDASIEANKITPSYQNIINISLKTAGKTREEFYKDLDTSLEKEREYYASMDAMKPSSSIDEDDWIPGE